ncbi:MAG: hypothetical protein II449_04365 [Prevotella sp.]|jgi:hypothetical protein|nr:hypothetical protein [Prevotella sp.]
MSKKTIIIILLALVAITGQAQTSFDPDEGCLNVIDISYAQGIGEYGDEGVSANYLHEKFINECLSIGAGIGYNHHEKYKFSAIPIYLSTHYFFLDRKFSPFVNLRVGGFAMFNAKKVGTKEKYSLSKDKQSFSLLVSPSVGVKMHITPNIGIMASISDEAYLLNAFDTNKNDYKNKLIHDLGISVGVCFQIKGW